jgi:uncharacterized membrane protein YuzA (DUF378 family)
VLLWYIEGEAYLKGSFMKIVQVLTWFLAVIGGLHFALSGIGIDLLGSVFGGNTMVLHIAIGVSVLYHGVPALQAKLAAL